MFHGNTLGQVKGYIQATDAKQLLDRFWGAMEGVTCEADLNLKSVNDTAKLNEIHLIIDAINQFIREKLVARPLITYSSKSIKKDLVDLIAKFFLISLNCGKCSLPVGDHFSLDPALFVFCVVCAAPAHKSCYSQVDLSAGVCFCCQECRHKIFAATVSDIDQDMHTTIVNVNVTAPGGSSSSQSSVVAGNPADNHPPPSTSQPPTQPPTSSHPGNSGPGRSSGYDRSVAVCKFLKRGTCKHGISGKGCTHYHPPFCSKYQNWGEDDRLGCNQGMNCKWYHPKLCKTSVEGGKCKARDCRSFHVKTRRKATRQPVPSPAQPQPSTCPQPPHTHPQPPSTLPQIPAPCVPTNVQAQDFQRDFRSLIQVLQSATETTTQVLSQLQPLLMSQGHYHQTPQLTSTSQFPPLPAPHQTPWAHPPQLPQPYPYTPGTGRQ